MWIKKFISIFLWISTWGLVDVILNKFKLTQNQLGVVYISGICITGYIISQMDDMDELPR